MEGLEILIEAIRPERMSIGQAVLADKGYDVDYIVGAAECMGALAVIPPKSSRIVQCEYDRDLYKERNLIERMFGKLKQFRRIATRYDKTKISFMVFIYLASIILWLK
ncbi:MAG: transposase [Nitrosomonas sp.]|nr:transposase [Nitrosomonas sp.]